MILVIVLVAFRLANPASLAELHALPKTFVCDNFMIIEAPSSGMMMPFASANSVSRLLCADVIYAAGSL